MKHQSPFWFLLFLVSVPLVAFGQLYRATVRPPELHEAALALKNGLSVLTIALTPGDEDFRLLADLRQRRAANIVSSYATNGEAGESDLTPGYPTQFAAELRSEASRAMELLGAHAYFLNLPDVGSSRDTGTVFKIWNRDSVEIRLMRLISLQRPHLIVLFPERQYLRASAQWEALRTCLFEAVRRLKPPSSVRELSQSAGIATWVTQRVVAGSAAPANSGKKGGNVQKAQAEYKVLWKQLEGDRGFVYREMYPVAKQLTLVDQGLPELGKTRLKTLIPQINRLANLVSGSRFKREMALNSVSALSDSVDFLIATQYSFLSHIEQKTLLLWKEALQDIRNGLLGVTVSCTLSERILAPRQLTYFSVDSIWGRGLPTDLWLYFPDVKNGWIINETADQRTPLKQGEQFRLVSPGAVAFNLPASLDGLDKNDLYAGTSLYIVGSGKDRTKNLVVKITLPIQFAPKFTVEPMTPVVRAIDGEYVIVRLTNHSRDGVRSQVEVDDSLVTSQKAGFRLHTKETTVTDTLHLTWHHPPPGTTLEKITIEGIPVARFVGRRFDVSVDSTRRIGLITTCEAGATAETLRRLKLRCDQARPGMVTQEWLARHDLVIVDRRILSLDSTMREKLPALKQFAAGGGHVIVLAQDAEAWNRTPLIEGVRLDESSVLDAFTEVTSDSTDAILSTPNSIQPEDWSQWLWHRAYNNVHVSGDAVRTPVRDRTSGSAFVVYALEGKGRVTYVDLAFTPQWLNIHVGAFRLFANLLSS